MKSRNMIGLVVNGAAAVLSAVCLILYVVNAGRSYYEDFTPMLACLFAGGLAAAVLGLVLGLAAKNKTMELIADVCRVAAVTLVMAGTMQFLSMRVASFGYIFASNLEKNNKAAWVAGPEAVRALIVMAITWLCGVVGSFLSLKRA